MAKQGSSLKGRLQLVEGVRAPIAYFTLALLVIEAILFALVASKRLAEYTNNVIAFGLVASLLVVLAGFLGALFLRPDILFQTRATEDGIEAFRKIGGDLTDKDLKILAAMLGRSANYFSAFVKNVMEEGDVNQTSREQKLKKLDLIKSVGASEVELTTKGTNFIQAVLRFSGAVVPPEMPAESVQRVASPRMYFGSIQRYLELGAEGDLAAMRTFSSGQLQVQKALTSDLLRSELTADHFDIVHLLFDVDQTTDILIFTETDTMKPEGFVKLIDQCHAALVVLATCNSIELGAKLSSHTNVIAATKAFTVDSFAPWATCFYQMLQKKHPVSRAFDIAKGTTDAPMVLFMKRDTVFN
jgi:hypothetical protein